MPYTQHSTRIFHNKKEKLIKMFLHIFLTYWGLNRSSFSATFHRIAGNILAGLFYFCFIIILPISFKTFFASYSKIYFFLILSTFFISLNIHLYCNISLYVCVCICLCLSFFLYFSHYIFIYIFLLIKYLRNKQ